MQASKEPVMSHRNKQKIHSFKVITKSTYQTSTSTKFLSRHTNLFNNIVVIAFIAVYLGFFGPILYWTQNI